MKDSRAKGAMAVCRPLWSLAVLAQAALLATNAAAFDIDTGNPELKLRWDNTLRYGAAWRVKGQDPTLLSNPNLDDGDRNFGKGLISNRIDILSELDAVHSSGFGARFSAAGWYDSVYNTSNDNPGFAGGAAPNQISVPYNEFPRTTRRLHGRQAELRDAFVFGKASIGDMPLTMRLGQHSLVWGESLFFANNGIAGAQSSFDISRLVADPTAQAKEFVLPVPQLSGQLQFTPNVSLGAYYQFRFRPNRLPAVGSYFSSTDVNVDGAERLLLGPTASASREADLKAKNSGQGGVQLRWRLGETDLGFYALRFHDKSFQQVTRLVPTPAGPFPGSYYLTYNEGTNLFGASASRTFGEANVAIEASIRRNQALSSSHAVDLSALGLAATDNDGHPGYARGNTAHVNLSTLWTLPSTPLWREAAFVGEIAWNRLLSCKVNCATALDPNASRDAVSLRAVLTPTYRQVMPGLDLDVPIGVGWTPKGSRSSLGPAFPAEGGGDFTIGLNGLYENVWRVNLAYTRFFGTAAPLLDATNSFSYQQTLRDRDFVALTVRRTF
jgi:hypothetical protein